MGTRNLSICKINEEYPIIQYGQWDGYPDGQGRTVLNFCKEEGNLEKLKSIAPNIKDVSTLSEYVEKFDGKKLNDDEKAQYYWNYFCHRDICAEIFEHVVNYDKNRLPECMNGEIYMMLYGDFDKLKNYADVWIEYTYIIDFDENMLYCWSHGNLLKSYSLDNIPDVDECVKELNKLDGWEE